VRAAPRFCCPRCWSDLVPGDGKWSCGRCAADYSLRHGFPDFRTGAAIDLDRDEDLKLAERLAAREANASFGELRAYYYSLRPEASTELHELHEAHFSAEGVRAARVVSQLGKGPLLDLGCGAGQYLLAAARAGVQVVGVDASLCQLILARRLLADQGLAADLALADAEALPFAAEVFHAVIAADIIEHVSEPAKLLAEAARVLAPRATLLLTTPNRYSLTPEPHVGLWGVGWLPHSAAVAYVRARTSINYRAIRLLSLGGLRRILQRTFVRVEIGLPQLTDAEQAAFRPLKRTLARAYAALYQLSPLRPVLLRIAPYFEATCRK
jgi:SAM-dependent methyltransferase